MVNNARRRAPKIPNALLENDPIAVLKDAHEKLKQAETLRQERSLDRAEEICLTLLRDFPDYYGALHTLGLVYGDKQEHALSVVYLVQAAMLNPTSWTTLTALAGEYLLLGAKEMASRSLRDALEISPKQPEIQVMLAELYYEEREYILSAEACEKALEIQPNMESALQSLAAAFIALGSYAKANETLERLAKIQRPTISVLSLFAQLPPALVQRDLIADLENVITQPGADPAQDQIDAAFVRAAAYDKMQKHQDAWDWAVRANGLVSPSVREEMSLDLKSVKDRADWLEKNITKFKDLNKKHDPDYHTSLFILGLSRSGKTTTESIISSQDSVYRGYENPAIQRAITNAYQNGALITFKSIGQLPLQLYPLVREYYQKLVTELIGDKQIFTNTTPGHIWDAPLVFDAIPNSKFVFVKRDSNDLLLRIFMKHYRSGNSYSYSLEGIREYTAAYNRMIDLMAEALPKDSLVINYEDMVTNPPRTLEQICELCGIEPNKDLVPEIFDDKGCGRPYEKYITASGIS